MTNSTLFFIFVPILAIALLAINILFAPHNPYEEKKSPFECGFHSFLGQNRTQFSISFFIFGLLFLLFDLEILLVYPYVVSSYTNGIYGLIIMLIFFLALTLGFVYELGKNALKIDSRQMLSLNSYITSMNTRHARLLPRLKVLRDKLRKTGQIFSKLKVRILNFRNRWNLLLDDYWYDILCFWEYIVDLSIFALFICYI